MRPLFPASVVLAVLLVAAARTTHAAAASAPAVVIAGADSLAVPPPRAGRAKPLAVVVADNGGAETTDVIIPYGVLKESGVADVRLLSTRPGPVQLFMSLRVAADQTLAQFDAAEPAGADLVIVPAQMRADDPVLVAWLKRQADRGATIVSICEGARVLAGAGLLDGRRATTHWHALPQLEKRYARVRWTRDRRYVQDGPIISTTGVSASVPVSLALVEAIGGRPVAERVAARIGASGWSAQHRTADYSLTAADYAAALAAMGAVWTHEALQIPIDDGVDEIALSLQADTWSRTYRAKVLTTHAGRTPVRSRHGLVVLPDDTSRAGRRTLALTAAPTLRQLDTAIQGVRRRYGDRAARLALLGLESPPAR